VNAEDKYGYTALHLAVLRGNLDIVKLFFDRGANVDVQNSYGDTALHLAIANELKRCVEPLISNDANEKIVNIDGLTPWDLKK